MTVNSHAPLGRAVKRLCKQRGVTMTQLAEHLGIARITLYQLVSENWRGHPVRPDCRSANALRSWISNPDKRLAPYAA